MSQQDEQEKREREERLKSALWYHVGQIVDAETRKLGCRATPQFTGSLTELVWAQIGNVAQDLESFAGHAGRTTIKIDDVLLLGRRNEGLEGILKEEVKRLNGVKKGKGKEKA